MIALLVAALAALQDDVPKKLAQLQPKIDRAIDRGTEWLVRMQARDGSWSFRAWGTWRGVIGQTALSLYTLLKAGLPADHFAVRRALVFLRREVPEIRFTYDAAMVVLALDAAGDKDDRDRVKSALRVLLANQRADGTWGYTAGGRADMSNTQVAALALAAAEKAKLDVPDRVYTALMEGVMKHREAPKEVDVPARAGETTTGKAVAAGWGYEDNVAYGSMTAGALSTLSICRLALERKVDQRINDQLKAEEQKALHWLAKHWTPETNPARSGVNYKYYWLYAVERAGSILGVDWLGTHHWYFEGAKELVERQADDGHWGDFNGEADTCFAVLFLKRATRWVRSGEGEKPKVRRYASDAGDVRIGGMGNDAVDVWIAGFSDAAKQKHALRVAKVEWLVDGKAAKVVAGDATKEWAGEQFAAKLAFASRGNHAVGARVHLAGATIEAAGFEVDVQGIWEEWMHRCAEGRSRNLLFERRVKVTASSVNVEGQEPHRVVDGDQCSFWNSGKGDGEPWIKLELEEPVAARALSLSQSNCRLEMERGHDRIVKVELRVNGGKPAEVALEADEMKPTWVDLPGDKVVVRTIEIRVLERVRAPRWPGHCGFSEIGLEK